MKLVFAPLKGLTDAHFRGFYFSHFNGFDQAMAPFLISHTDESIREQEEGRVGPVETTPQLLGNDSKKILHFAQHLSDKGFSHFNLNLGCPAPLVIKKSKGSALLGEPERLKKLLCDLSEHSPLPFSVKTRLGYSNQSELLPQLSGWKDLGIEELTIHARSGAQLYSGETNWQSFYQCAQEWGSPVIYNGDITSLEVYQKLLDFMGDSLGGVMIGRGIFSNPFIAEEIKQGKELPQGIKGERFLSFHRDITAEMNQRPKFYSRLKALWTRFAPFVHLQKVDLQRMVRMSDPDEFNQLIEEKIKRTFSL